MAFETALQVEHMDGHRWRLLKPLKYRGNRQSFEVPTATITDFASVPIVIRWLVPKYGRYNKAAVLHDWLVSPSNLSRPSRRDADGLFRRTMRELGVGFLRRRTMWAAVRIWGGLGASSFVEQATAIFFAVLAAPFVALGGVAVVALRLAYWVVEFVFYVLLSGIRWSRTNVWRANPAHHPPPNFPNLALWW